MLQAMCEVEPLFDVPPAAFRPPPKVDSAVVRLVPKPASKIGVEDKAMFERVVREAFGMRRKTLRNALQAVCDADAIAAAGIRPELRAEQVEVAGFINLSNRLAAAAASG
jgi:16S rRNA (adenine1518-N6/adenine1519-N6)-dimethyltransferase